MASAKPITPMLSHQTNNKIAHDWFRGLAQFFHWTTPIPVVAGVHPHSLMTLKYVEIMWHHMFACLPEVVSKWVQESNDLERSSFYQKTTKPCFEWVGNGLFYLGLLYSNSWVATNTGGHWLPSFPLFKGPMRLKISHRVALGVDGATKQGGHPKTCHSGRHRVLKMRFKVVRLRWFGDNWFYPFSKRQTRSGFPTSAGTEKWPQGDGMNHPASVWNCNALVGNQCEKSLCGTVCLHQFVY